MTPNLDTFAPGQGDQLTEDWISLCDSTGTKCVTLASFSPDALDIAYGPGQNSYFGLHGRFAIAPRLGKTITLWIAPYRFDDVINGMTVRQWIYQVGGKSSSRQSVLGSEVKTLLAKLADPSFHLAR
jgi:hypothetical protein